MQHMHRDACRIAPLTMPLTFIPIDRLNLAMPSITR